MINSEKVFDGCIFCTEPTKSFESWDIEGGEADEEAELVKNGVGEDVTMKTDNIEAMENVGLRARKMVENPLWKYRYRIMWKRWYVVFIF